MSLCHYKKRNDDGGHGQAEVSKAKQRCKLVTLMRGKYCVNARITSSTVQYKDSKVILSNCGRMHSSTSATRRLHEKETEKLVVIISAW